MLPRRTHILNVIKKGLGVGNTRQPGERTHWGRGVHGPERKKCCRGDAENGHPIGPKGEN